MKIVNVNVIVVKKNTMIKLKSLLFEQEERKIHPLVSNWENEKAQKYASILIEKYGEWIVYKPPLNKGNSVLWLFPYLIFIIGGIMIFLLLKKRPNR